MKKYILLIPIVFLVNGCVIADMKAWIIKFFNNSDINIYAIIDLEPEDDKITEGSTSCRVSSKGEMHVGRKYRDGPWHDAVGEYFHVYILDATVYYNQHMQGNGIVTHEDIISIPRGIIIARMTVYRDEFRKGGDHIIYPPQDMSTIQYY